MTITVSTADPRSTKALTLLEGSGSWTRGHRKDDGRPFLVIPGSGDHVYWVDGRACTCPDHTRRGLACKHMLALRLWIARQAPRPSAADLRALTAND